jgi:hypothetical protein
MSAMVADRAVAVSRHAAIILHGTAVSAEALTPVDRIGLHGTGVSAEALTPVDRIGLHGTGVSAEALTPVDTGEGWR